MIRTRPLLALALILSAVPAQARQSTVNFETPHVHPLELDAVADRLLAVNTPDGRLEVFDLSSGVPVAVDSIPVGIDPVTVRVRPGVRDEAWVVNQLSDTISVVDLGAGVVVHTIVTEDEPADLVFAGTPQRAFVTCSQTNAVLVYDPDQLGTPPVRISIAGEDPRALAVSPSGDEVYVAVFESGNGTTILGGGLNVAGGFPPNVVSDPTGPHGGVNPPPNDGAGFFPPIEALPQPPPVGLIVRKNESGRWMDDNGGDWTDMVSGPQAAASGRPVGWDLPDRDVARIRTDDLSVSYFTGLMNIVMSIAVQPRTGRISVIGTDATNEVRFEPVLNGRFLRVNLGFVDPTGKLPKRIADLNPHLDYSTSTVPQAQRDQSIGDPRGIVWNAAGTRAWVTGMGSNNVIAVSPTGRRAGVAPTIEVGEGPTGLALDEDRGQLYVLNKFESAISVVDLGLEHESARVPFHDSSVQAIKLGRKHLYDTHKNSGLGHVSCASCHVDARMDRLGWDLGHPAGPMKSQLGQNLGAGLPNLTGSFEPFHPMKGPMTTQTLQDIIGKEPLHWRGDRDGIEEFSGAFTGLQGDDVSLTASEMQEFEDFLATLHFPPNPFRNPDNSLPTDLPLPGHYAVGRFAPAGTPLPNGDAQRGLALSRPPSLLDGFACTTCHTLPTGMGTGYTMAGGGGLQPFPLGPNGEEHHALVSVDGSTNVTMKIPQLRNMYDKVGFDLTQTENLAGFGFFHDGSIDSMSRFFSEPFFAVQSDQDVADIVAFMLAFSGSDLPVGSTSNLLEPPGPTSKDAHASVGRQVTVKKTPLAPPVASFLTTAAGLANAGEIGLVVHGLHLGERRSWTYLGSGLFQSDRSYRTHTFAELIGAVTPKQPLTFTAVASGTGFRIGIDRDEDGALDGDERDAGTDPADASSTPPPCSADPPSAAEEPGARALGTTRIGLTWTDVNDGELGYRVERRARGELGPFQLVAILPPNAEAYTDGDLDCWRRYTYRVTAFNCGGQASSAEVTARTALCPGGVIDEPELTPLE